MRGKTYFIIEHLGVPVDVTCSYTRAFELVAQHSSRSGKAVLVEAEALQQELSIPMDLEAASKSTHDH